ncbi:hypothetical protein GCM10010274_58740 [Streptomyces lavendofoliae]|uniref:Uncharacterized protein n=1 Tax=Streptomyces lavendofoliae TaxID=67314 RepID=A0A918M6T6_9ACTN|nr:hypothetical protein GCM10010274_58740 [Streptomyces lavendofoliae]
MKRRRGWCPVCGRPSALTRAGRVWEHGPGCPGAGRMPADAPPREHIWPARYRGRRVTTIRGGIDRWTPTEGAA